MVKTFDILLDLEKELYSPSSLLFSVSRNDFNTVQLNFVITQDGTPVDLTNKTVELAVKKPSGLSLYQACEVTSAQEGKAKLALNQQAYIEYGIYTAEVYIRDANQLAVTSPFWYQSRTPIFNDTTEEAIQSSNDWSALQEALFAYDLRPKIIEGFPTITPEYIGQMAFDSLNKITYIASDLTSNSWVTFGTGEGGGGGGNDTIFGDNPLNFTPIRKGQMFIDEINENVYIAIGATAEDWLQIDNEDFVKQAITWAEVLDKPTTFAPEAHGHEIIEVLGLQDALDLKADGIHSHDWAEIDNKPLTFTPEAHDHDWTEINGKPLAFVPEVHTHAWIDITDKPLTFAPSAHNHDWAEVTNKPLSFAPSTHRHDWAEIDGKPLTFVPEVHTHAWVDITDKPLAFNPETHNHAIAEVTGLQNAIDAKANVGASYSKNETYSKAEVYNKTEIDQLTFGTGEGSAVIVEDNLMSISPTNALSANQGRILEEMKADVIHNHTWGEITGKPLTFSPDAHTHTKAQITDFAHTHTKAQITDFAHNHDWAEVTGKPLTFSPEIHNHAISEVTGLQLALDGKADDSDLTTKANIADVYTKLETYNKTEVDTIVTGITEGGGTVVEDNLLSNSASSALSANQGRILDETKADLIHSHDWAEVTGKPLAFVPEVHTHAWVDITDKPLTFAPSAHNHDWAEVTNKPLSFAPEAHNHVISEVTGLQASLDSKADDAHNHSWGEITEKPTTFTPETHNHTKAQITDFAHNHAWAEVTGKPLAYPAISHFHEIADINNLQTSLDSKALTTYVDTADNFIMNTLMDGLKLWSGTQAEYDAIPTKDDTTLYFITPTKLILNVTNLTNSVQLDWEVGTGVSWAIWRSEVKDSLGTKLVDALITNTYLDSTASGGTTYYYTLQVEDVSQKTISDQVEATPYSITVYGSKRVEFVGYAGWTVYGTTEATADFGNQFTLQGGDRLKVDTTERLRFYLPAGMVGSANTGGIIKANIAGKTDYTIEYGIRFDLGFPWSKGGKVPGFSGGAGYTGGAPAWNGDGFSVRLMWREGGRIIPYVYHYNQPDEFGDTFGETLGYFTDTQEHIVKYYAVLNTGSNPNGILKIYLDGVQVFEKRDLIYRTDDSKIDTAHIAIFAGGSGADWNMSADGYIRLNYFDWK